jgi:hypothetical protein
MTDKSRARASHDQHADTRNEQHLTRAAENRVRQQEQERAQRRAAAVSPWDDGPPNWDQDFWGTRW